MLLANFMTTLGRIFTGKIAKGSEFIYSMREGLNPRDPAYLRWGMAVKEENIPPRTELEVEMPPKRYKLILRDKFGLRPDDIFYFSQDKKRVDVCLAKILEELRCRTAAEFFSMWILDRNLDFLTGVEDDFEFEER
ncbi:MAG: hypothetical protein A2Y63_01340 [Candidatus Riflebacteria bacterium RBG_13_59_9]|nr:MAG: hypothetical protein A2Y63_01340 [Candidatus Riflebacteria bacterium RBG_13_59_9]